MVANFKFHPFIFLKGLKSWGHYGKRNKENQLPREGEGEAGLARALAAGAGEGVLSEVSEQEAL